MMKIKSVFTPLLAAALLCNLGAAHAAQEVHSELRYSYQLIDLDPNDGVTPGFTYFQPYFMFGNGINQQSANFAPGQEDYRSGYKYVQAGEDSAQLNLSGVRNETSYSSTEKHAHIQELSVPGYAYAKTWLGWQFGLTPNTRLEIRGVGEVNGALDAQNGLQQASARNDFHISYYSWTDGSEVARDFSMSQQGGVYQRSQEFSLQIDNAHNSDGGYYFYSNAEASLRNVAAVPEAETWAMLGGGLLMLGALARRRKQA